MAVEFHHNQIKILKNDEITIAKLRWKFLARALFDGKVEPSILVSQDSCRNFTSFGLITLTLMDDVQNDNSSDIWYQLTCLEETRLKLKIKLYNDDISTDQLTSYDNTGNVCIWPSEEVLTYYCMKNKELFGGNSVCELGGGMTCLSGLAIAATAGAKEVFVTDGNLRCVENVQSIIQQNLQHFGATHVVSRHLQWEVEEDSTDLKSRFDVVICADCLFYDNGRQALSDTIWKILKDDGVAVILAPLRDKSFQDFVDVVGKDFMIERLMAYDTHVWELHCRLKNNEKSRYKENVHYPQMLILRKF